MTAIRGQSSLELLLIFAVALFILTTMIILSSDQLGTIASLKEQDDAVNSVQDVSAAAKDVYSQGEGARKQVYISLPSSYDPSTSRIGNRSLILRVRGTDYAAAEDFDVHGTWPGSPGNHWVWVISEGNKVRIGTAMITLSKNHISLIMSPNSTASVQFFVESLWDEDIDVDSSLQWSHTEVIASDDVGSFVLAPAQTHEVNVVFDSGPDAVGFYTGELVFTATEGTLSETVRLPMTVEIAGFHLDAQPPLEVIPDFWADEVLPGEYLSQAFAVCTNSQTEPSSVTFTPTTGAPGDWINGTDPMGPMGGGECQLKILQLIVPSDAGDGTYSGSIEVVGEGAIGAEDTIELFFTIDQNGTQDCPFNLDEQSMCNCPVGSNYQETPLCNCLPATIYVLNGIVHGGPDNGLPYNGTLRSDAGTDIIVGTNESDIIYTGTGNDRVCGGPGDDILYGDNSNDILDGGEGNDIIYGGGSGDWIYGKEGDDELYGGQGDDEIDGGGGNDYIVDEGGKDLIYGGSGSDTVYAGDGDDIICGISGHDILHGEFGKDLIDGGGDVDTIDGGDSADTCYRGESVTNCEDMPGDHLPICGPE